jgi:hypothetical protein
MFKHPNPYKKVKLSHIFEMPDNCPECGQKYELENGFWYGTGYVSYALAVAISVTTFVAWLVLIGVSTENDNSVESVIVLKLGLKIGSILVTTALFLYNIYQPLYILIYNNT